MVTQAELLVDKMPDADPETLLYCTASVYERYRAEGKQPGSEHWTVDSRTYRAQMIADVFTEWVTATGSDKYFPWCDDFVCRRWLDWRKTSKGEKLEYCKQNRITFPSDQSDDRYDAE